MPWALLALAMPAAACAQNQPPFSQRASLMQMMGFTRITVTYGRPIARGRTLFGGLVKWGKVWTPGADSASAIEFDRPVTVAGKQVPAGHYSIWLIPDSTSWILILNDRGHVFHTNYPGESHDVLRVELKPETGPHVEALLFYSPEADREHVVLRIAWGETFVSIPIHVVE
jgi:hypothetical protein